MVRHIAALLVLVAVAFTSLSGCLGAKHPWSAGTVLTEEVRVIPQEVYRRKNRLYVRVAFVNLGQVPLLISRDLVKAQLNTGALLDRSTGLTSTHKAYTLQPGGTQDVYVDFKHDAILNASSAYVFWTGAVFDGAREVPIPATPVQVAGP